MKFYVWEGLDGSGKTTAIRNTYEILREKLPAERRIILLEEPGKSGYCGDIRNLIMDGRSIDERGKLLLFQASRAAMTGEIARTFTKDEIILCDRFTPSTIAYQGWGRGMDLEFLREMNEFSSNGVMPERVFYLSISSEDAKARKNPENYWDRFDLEFYRRVELGYLSEFAGDIRDAWKRIDALRPAQEIAEICAEEILRNES